MIRSACSVADLFPRIPGARGNVSAAMRAETNGGILTRSLCLERVFTLLVAQTAGKSFLPMGIATGSFAATSVTLSTDLEVGAMNKDIILKEAAYQVAVELAEVMMKKKLITSKEYEGFVEEMLRKYKPVFGSLYR